MNNGEEMAAVARIALDRRYAFPVLNDLKGNAHRLYGVTLRPTTAIVGPDGSLLAIRVGAHSTAGWRELLAAHRLQGPSATDTAPNPAP